MKANTMIQMQKFLLAYQVNMNEMQVCDHYIKYYQLQVAVLKGRNESYLFEHYRSQLQYWKKQKLTLKIEQLENSNYGKH